jgi:hypothetical protein
MLTNLDTSRTIYLGSLCDKFNKTANPTKKHLIQLCYEYQLFNILHPIELVFKYGALTILCLFIVEILIKLFVDPKILLKKLEILDMFIVIASFIINTFIIVRNIHVHSVSSLLTILR